MDQYQQSRFGDREAEQLQDDGRGDLRRHKPLQKLSEATVQNIKNIEEQVKNRQGNHSSKEESQAKKVDIRDYMSDD
jgi:hypothetical protein